MKKFKLNFIFIIFLLLAGSLPGTAVINPDGVQVNKVRIIQGEYLCQVDVDLSENADYQVLLLKDENFLVLDILDAVNELKKSSLDVNNGFIKKVRSSQYKMDPRKIVRIVFELKELFPYRIENISTGLRLIIENPNKKIREEKNIRIKAEENKPEENKEEENKEEKNGDSKKIEEIKRDEGIHYDNDGLITMGFSDMEISEVLRMFSYSTGINTVVGDEVKGKISIRLVKVPWEQALKAILKAKGYSYIKDKGIIWVSSIEKINTDLQSVEKEKLPKAEEKPEKKQPVIILESRTINLSYANIDEVKSNIQNILSEHGSILVDNRMKSMIVRDIVENMKKIDEIVSFLDRRTPQVSIESMLIEITSDDTRRLGINWGEADGTANGIKTINSNGRAVMNAGLLPAVSGTSNMTIGTVVDNFALNAAIHAMLSQGTTELLASPKVVTLNNQNATITIGKKIPIRMLDDDGRPVTKFVSVGIKLDVKPHITADGHISMDIRPEVSYVEPNPVSGGDIEINTTEAQTFVMVKDLQTAVIGGLTRKDISQTEDKVPLLSNIPLLGFFFKGKANSDSRKELLIFVTPHIITDEEMKNEAVLGLKRMEEVSLDKNEKDSTEVTEGRKKKIKK